MKKLFIKTYRSIVVSSLFVLFGFGALFIRYLIFPFQKDKISNYETLQKSWIFFIYLMKKTGIISVTIDNIKFLKNLRSSIIVSTHPSFIDIVILMSVIPYSTCFVAEKLAKNPFLKGMVTKLFILEGQEMNKWVQDATNALNEGLNVIIFPMGTRHRKNEYPRIRRGSALIALESKKNIIMLKMENSSDFLQIHQPFYEAGEKCVEYNIELIGEIDTQDYLNKYPDNVSFKTEITRNISNKLYNK